MALSPTKFRHRNESQHHDGLRRAMSRTRPSTLVISDFPAFQISFFEFLSFGFSMLTSSAATGCRGYRNDFRVR